MTGKKNPPLLQRFIFEKGEGKRGKREMPTRLSSLKKKEGKKKGKKRRRTKKKSVPLFSRKKGRKGRGA